MSGHWYDSILSGAGSMVDMFTGAPSGTTAAGASAASTMIGSAADAATAHTDFGKATGLAPYAQLLGLTPASPAATPSTPAATPGWNTGGVTSTHESNGFERDPAGGYKLPSSQHWDAVGRSGGNSSTDTSGDAIKVSAPEIYQPDLSKIPRTVVGQKTVDEAAEGENVTGAGYFHERASGSHTDGLKEDGSVDPDWYGGAGVKINAASGKGVTTFYNKGYQAGFEDKEGYRAVAMSDDKRYTASAEAGTVVSGGYSGSVGLDTEKGLYATGGIGGKSGLYAQADADAKTEKIKVGGVDYDAGIGVHGDTFFGVKGGASGTIGLGPDFAGAKGSIGAFAGAEAAADVHGNLGPLGAKLGASGMAGAGIGADGDISYKDGKFHMGGKLFAALGYGGSLSGDVTIDVGKIGTSIANGASTVGGYIADGASAVGGAISNGASAVGGAISDGASAVYNGIGSLFSW